MGTGFAQTDPRFGPHALGYGPALGTIHDFGCKLVTFDDFVKWSGWATDPVQLDVAMVAHGGIFQRDPTGTFDYIPDNALQLLWPDRFKWIGTWPGLRVDVIDRYLPTPDVFIALWIRAAGVPTHFFPLIAGNNGHYVTDDSWDNIDKPISAYAGLVVQNTIAIQVLHPSPPPKPVPQPPASQPPPASPPQPPLPPVVLPSEPYSLFDFIVVAGDSPDLHPMAGTFTPSEAITLANEWVADKPAGYQLDVMLQFGLEEATGGAGPRDRVIYTATSPGVGGRAGDA